MQKLLIGGLIVIGSIILLTLSVSLARAESIADCVGEGVIATQTLSDGNAVRWADDGAALRVDYAVEPDYAPVLLNGAIIDRAFYWSETRRHESLRYAFEGAEYLFVYDEDNRPHGSCLLRVS